MATTTVLSVPVIPARLYSRRKADSDRSMGMAADS